MLLEFERFLQSEDNPDWIPTLNRGIFGEKQAKREQTSNYWQV